MKNLLKQFNPFNRPQVTVLEQPAEVKNYGTYPQEVYEIHHAFETAGETILAEANAILQQCQTKSIDKGKRLIHLGFGQSKEAVIATETISKEATAKQTADLVIYYKVNYPNNKFITETQVKAICEKWNLVCGGIELFKGFVPEKNLKQIETFKLKEVDKTELLLEVTNPDGSTLEYITEKDLTAHGKRYFSRTKPSIDFAYISVTGSLSQLSSSELFSDQLNEKYKEQSFIRATLVTDKFKICAPLADMDTTGMRLNGYKLEKHIPDPVVLQPVRGGYLIVTAWGDEATDENVVNQNHN